MVKFKSLFFRELRISRKNMIIRFVLLTVLGLFYAVGISAARSNPEFKEYAIIFTADTLYHIVSDRFILLCLIN